MKRTYWLSFAATLSLALPAAAQQSAPGGFQVRQDSHNQVISPGSSGRAQTPPVRRPPPPSGAPASHGPVSAGGSQPQGGGMHAGGAGPVRPVAPGATPVRPFGGNVAPAPMNRPGPTQPGPTVERHNPYYQAGQGDHRGYGDHGRTGLRPPPNLPRLGDWNRNLIGQDRDRAREAWRRGHGDWDHDSPWRRDRDWWRHDRGFFGYYGPRLGFFFMPAYGYITAPPDYQRSYWGPGQYLPQWFWQYTVNDYWTYGLPAPPDGCAWVWVDGDVALIQLSDGYILDIVHNVY